MGGDHKNRTLAVRLFGEGGQGLALIGFRPVGDPTKQATSPCGLRSGAAGGGEADPPGNEEKPVLSARGRGEVACVSGKRGWRSILATLSAQNQHSYLGPRGLGRAVGCGACPPQGCKFWLAEELRFLTLTQCS
jgi:hypothetical protein